MICYMCNIFPQYLRFTTCHLLYSDLLKGLPYIGWFYYWKVCDYMICVVFGLSSVYLLLTPSEKSRMKKLMEEKKHERMELMKKDP
jgi:hypothetical protein